MKNVLIPLRFAGNVRDMSIISKLEELLLLLDKYTCEGCGGIFMFILGCGIGMPICGICGSGCGGIFMFI